MIIGLTNLRSTNSNGSRSIYVTVTADGQQTDTTLNFLICNNNYPLDIVLGPNQSKEVSVNHNESGQCWVVVTDSSNTQMSTRKFLNLDALESF